MTQETSYVLKVKRCQSVLNTKNVKRDRVQMKIRSTFCQCEIYFKAANHKPESTRRVALPTLLVM
jgi:hypothetical protein